MGFHKALKITRGKEYGPVVFENFDEWKAKDCSLPLSYSYFELGCNGNESLLEECQLKRQVYFCETPDEAAGVVCQENRGKFWDRVEPLK